MGRVEGKVALVTGAARGQGRAMALRLAEEGADIIAVDLSDRSEYSEWITYPMATEDQLEETARLVSECGRRVMPLIADVRIRNSISQAVSQGATEFGRLDIVCASAGISPFGPKSWLITERQWDDIHSVNLKGVWNTSSAAIPHMIEARNGGSIVMTSSGAALMCVPNISDYVASKLGLIGLMRSVSKEVGEFGIRVNCIAPGAVNTDMIQNAGFWRLARPDLEHPTSEDMGQAMSQGNQLGVKWVEPVDIANAALWLSSDEARYVTGIVLPVDAGISS